MNLSPKIPCCAYLELVLATAAPASSLGRHSWSRLCAPRTAHLLRHRTQHGRDSRGTLFRDNPQPTRIQSITEGVLTYVQLPGTVFAKTHAF